MTDAALNLDGLALDLDSLDLDGLEKGVDALVDAVRYDRLKTEYWDLSLQFPRGMAPYAWQQEFHAAGGWAQRRGLIAANRVGKTRTAAFEVAMHATGLYPPWWTGKRFDRPTSGWCVTDTNESCRDITMKELLGSTLDPDMLGTGAIPRHLIDRDSLSMRSANIKGVLDSVRVKHVSGGLSTIKFKSYEQGREKFQGTALDFCWLDEQPPEDIAGECEMRLLTTNGLLIATFTPLQGRTGYVGRFLKRGPGIYCATVGWDLAPHISEKAKREAAATMLPHERDARMRGIPTVGTGLIFAGVDFEPLIDKSATIESHHRRIVGIDFGYDHPAATVLVGIDERGVVTVRHAEKESRMTAAQHVARINQVAPGCVVAWPHDGLQAEKSSGVSLMRRYRDAGAKMLGISARYEDKKGGGQDVGPWVMEVRERAAAGTLRIHPQAARVLLEETASWHYDKNGRVVRENDDAISAWRYAMMMLRYARLPAVAGEHDDAVRVVDRPYAIGFSPRTPQQRIRVDAGEGHNLQRRVS